MPDRRVWSERLTRISRFRRFLPTRGSQRSFPFIVLFVTLLIVAGLTLVLDRVTARSDQAIFEREAERIHREIKLRIDAAVGLVRGASALSFCESLNHEVFRTFVDRLGPLVHYQGVENMGFCRAFTSKADINKRLRAEHGPKVSLQQMHGKGNKGYAILFVEPAAENQWALGWDLYDEPAVRRLAMDAAFTANEPRASRWAKLPVDASGTNAPGIYVFNPVYAGDLPTETLFERDKALIGYTYCTVLLSKLFDGVFSGNTPPSTLFRVYEGETIEPQSLIYASSTEEVTSEARRHVKDLRDHGVNWLVDYRSLPEFDKVSSRGLIPWIAIGGVVCALLLFLATFALVHARIDAERIEAILREKTMELARSNTDLERFAYVASHDLREPLRMVTSYVQLLEKRYASKLDTDAREFIGFAVDGATRMNEFLDGLLHLSRVSRDPGVHEACDSNRAVNTALGNLKRAIEDSSAEVTVDRLPPALINDTHLLQLFQNLIGNAIKFQKGGAPRVHVSAVREGDFVRFAVKDNGIGIDATFADQVFEVFRRLHTRDHYPGSGIGLAICKRIVEQRGGRIWFDSKPGQGTTFYFTLPAG